MLKPSYNFGLSVRTFAIQQGALLLTLQPPSLYWGVFLTRSHKMPDRTLTTHLPGMQHETPQHHCPPLPMECHLWLEPMAPHCLMGKSSLPTSLGTYYQDNAAIPKASGTQPASQTRSVLPVPPSTPSTSPSLRLPAPRRPPSSPLNEARRGNRGERGPAPSPLIGCLRAVI